MCVNINMPNIDFDNMDGLLPEQFIYNNNDDMPELISGDDDMSELEEYSDNYNNNYTNTDNYNYNYNNQTQYFNYEYQEQPQDYEEYDPDMPEIDFSDQPQQDFEDVDFIQTLNFQSNMYTDYRNYIDENRRNFYNNN
jgi:hypothetical protein